MKLNEVFPSKYVKAEDLQGREVPVIISDVIMEKLGDDTKLVMHFQGRSKGMVTNKTNAGRIAYLYGDDTDGWIGKEIILAAEFVEFQGKTVKGLRVRPPTNRQPGNVSVAGGNITNRGGYDIHESSKVSAPQSAPPPRDDMDQEIPF